MATDIYFTGTNARVTVAEEPSQVAEAFMSADGRPFRLTAPDAGGEIYVNPSTVAFWFVAGSRHHLDALPEVPEASPQPAKERQPVTDIWGKPLRRKRPTQRDSASDFPYRQVTC